MNNGRIACSGRNALTLFAAGALVGCGTGIGSQPPKPLTSDAFVLQRAGAPPHNGPLDRQAPLLYDNVRLNLGSAA